MLSLRLRCLIVLIPLLAAACGEDDSPITAALPTLIAINTDYSTSDDLGQAIGTVPPITTGVKYVRSANNGTATPPQSKLIKDLPYYLRKKISAAPSHFTPRAPAVKINDATTSWSFSAYNASDKKITVHATKRATGSKCYVFVENGQEGTHDWQAVAKLFDTQVWPKDTSIFGPPTDVDSNGKVVILYYKMRDDSNVEVPDVLGYFFPGDLITGSLPPGTPYSNKMEIYYLNLAFGGPLHPEMKRTLFHEFQHMINYGQRRVLANKPEMDTWLDEGLAESAEHYGLGTPGYSRIESMNADSSKRIRNGEASLFYWEGDDANYALAYTFVQYCRLQTGQWTIMSELIHHAFGDYRAIEAVVGGKVSEINTFDKILRAYHVARLVNGPGIHGFKAENSTFQFTLHRPTANLSSLKILPGSAVYLPVSQSDLDAFVPKDNGPKIKFYKHRP